MSVSFGLERALYYLYMLGRPRQRATVSDTMPSGGAQPLPVHGERNNFQIFLELAHFSEQASSSLFYPLVLSGEGIHAWVGSQQP